MLSVSRWHSVGRLLLRAARQRIELLETSLFLAPKPREVATQLLLAQLQSPTSHGEQGKCG